MIVLNGERRGLTSLDIRMRHVCTQESRFSLLEFHNIQQENTKYPNIPRILLIQHQRQIHQPFLTIHHSNALLTLTLISLHKLPYCLFISLLLGRHDSSKDLLEDFLDFGGWGGFCGLE
jgi:hypothetical protein